MLLGREGFEFEKQWGGDFLPFGGDQKPRARSDLLIQDESCGEFGYGDTVGAVAGHCSGMPWRKAVQISSRRWLAQRLCRPARRKGFAFPHSKRRSRTPQPVGCSVIWTSLRHGVPLRKDDEGVSVGSGGPAACQC